MKANDQLISDFKSTATAVEQASGEFLRAKIYLNVLLDIRSLLMTVVSNTTKKTKE